MSSDWKQNAVDRSDFRHGKTDPDETPKKHRGKKKKKVVVQFRYNCADDEECKRLGFFSKDWQSWGKYAKEADALKAIEAQRTKPFWGEKFEWRIKGKKGNV
jgi:hypothetical protein